MREDDDVPRAAPIGPAFAGRQDRLGLAALVMPTSLLLCTSAVTADALSQRTAVSRKGSRTTLVRTEGRVRDPARLVHTILVRFIHSPT